MEFPTAENLKRYFDGMEAMAPFPKIKSVLDALIAKESKPKRRKAAASHAVYDVAVDGRKNQKATKKSRRKTAGPRFWTDERDAKLKAMVKKKKSSKFIAARFKITPQTAGLRRSQLGI